MMDNINLLETNMTSHFEERDKIIEIPTTPINGCYEINNHSIVKEKKGFWQSLFGERKCKYCSLKKDECSCKTRKILSDIELKSASTQTCINRGSGQGKSQSSGHRGCGVHLHFCIEPKPKKDHLKSSSALRCSNLRMSSNINQKHCSQSVPSAFVWHQIPVAEVVNDSQVPADEAKINIPNQLKKENIEADTIQKLDNHLFSKVSSEPLEMQTKDTKPLFIDEYASSKEDTNKVETPKELELSENTKSLLHENESKKSKCPCEKTLNNETERLEKHAEKELKQSKEKNNTRVSILRKTMYDIPKENLVFPLIPHTNDNFKDTFDIINHTVDYIKQEKCNDDEENKKVISVKMTSPPSARSTFVRNSLIDIRREQKSVFLEEKISIILSKLNSIEDKILELEKDNSCGASDDITISCNSKKSTVSIEFGKKENASAKEKLFEAAQASVKPPTENFNTVKLTSKTENVYINSNRNISVVKQFKRKPKSMNTKQVVYFNPYELDAHSLASNSYLNPRTPKCKNPRFLIQCSTKNNKSEICDKWRRISEELKISDSDLTK